MIDATQWTLLHATYGRVVLQTHVIEQRVALQVSIWHGLKSSEKDRPFNDDAFSMKHSELRRASFGKIMKTGLSNGAIAKEDRETFEKYRRLRNLLVHDISDSISLRLLTKGDSENVISELNEIAEIFEGINAEILKSIQFLFIAAGGKSINIDETMEHLLARLSKLDRLGTPESADCE